MTSFAGSAGSSENAPNDSQLPAPWDTLPTRKRLTRAKHDKEKRATETHVDRKNLKSNSLKNIKAKSEMDIQII